MDSLDRASVQNLVYKAEYPHQHTLALHRTATERVIQHMRANLDASIDNVSLAALATICGYSRAHLIGIFQAVTGVTPHHFLTSLRIEHSKQLLLETEFSVARIAIEVGYRSTPTFSRTFDEYVGLSPAAFRHLPPRLSIGQLLAGLDSLRAMNESCESTIEVEVIQPDEKGVVFVGTFNRGVPQGKPYSGTVLSGEGSCRLPRPPQKEFHVLAALIDLSDNISPHSIEASLVAAEVVRDSAVSPCRLELRPLAQTDPPVVTSPMGLLGITR